MSARESVLEVLGVRQVPTVLVLQVLTVLQVTFSTARRSGAIHA